MDDIIDEKIRKILGYKTWNIKRKVDALLKVDHEMYMELGLDSTKKKSWRQKKKP